MEDPVVGGVVAVGPSADWLPQKSSLVDGSIGAGRNRA
jgi:hypothetical protein